MPLREKTNYSLNSVRLVVGRSTEGRALVAHEFFRGDRGSASGLLVLGGMHGDEPKSIYVVEQLLRELRGRPNEYVDTSERRNTVWTAPWVLMPMVNPDGCERRTRRNARKVDLNRNFPTKNWEAGDSRSRMFGGFKPASEPETKAVMRLIERVRPAVIVTIHSINRNRFCNNYDGPGRKVARLLAKYNKYPVTSTIGYPTPGSFGTWAGVERGIPTITLELPSHHSSRRCWEDNREALLSLGL